MFDKLLIVIEPIVERMKGSPSPLPLTKMYFKHIYLVEQHNLLCITFTKKGCRSSFSKKLSHVLGDPF